MGDGRVRRQERFHPCREADLARGASSSERARPGERWVQDSATDLSQPERSPGARTVGVDFQG